VILFKGQNRYQHVNIILVSIKGRVAGLIFQRICASLLFFQGLRNWVLPGWDDKRVEIVYGVWIVW